MAQKTREELDAAFSGRRVKPNVYQAFTDLLDSVPTKDEVGEGGGLTEIVQDTSPQLGGNLDLNGHNVNGITPTEIGHLDNVSSNIQTQLTAKAASSDLTSHTSNTSNPHSVTKSQVGLSAVTNVDHAAALATHTGNTSNPHSVTKSQVGLGNVANTKNNFAASDPPSNSNDSGSGYSVGSVWIDTSNDNSYVCLDSTADNAIWHQIDSVAKIKTDGSTPPNADDDITNGWRIGSIWIDTTGQETYICLSNSDGAALWKQITNESAVVVNTWQPANVDDEYPLGQLWYATTQRTLHVLHSVPSTDNAVWRQVNIPILNSSMPQTSDYQYELGQLWYEQGHENLYVLDSITGSPGSEQAQWRQVNLPFINSSVPSNSDYTYNVGQLWFAMGGINNTLWIMTDNDFDAATWQQINYKNNLSASAPPTADDDILDGYTVGSRWVVPSWSVEYICTDSTSTAAVWKQLSVRHNSTSSQPDNTNDNTQGFGRGSIWVYDSTDIPYLCLHADTNAAVWYELATAIVP